jgi:DNA invertase Pin-like site-specific DNA recombinase
MEGGDLMTTRTINVIKAKPQIQARKRVAAYIRVSNEKESMIHSMSAQISYFNQLIGKRMEWTLVGIYTDEGLTGTKEDRVEFNHLLDDCRAGKIDLVITKSISRFARNTVTLLASVRELKGLGIDVFFERENIHSLSNDGEVMLTILASYAQAESLSASENGKWRIRKRFAQGEVFQLQPVFGYKIRDNSYVLDPDQAEVVKFIFESYTSGMQVKRICSSLNSNGVPTFWDTKWSRILIRNIVRNCFYTGQVELQRYFVEDHIEKKIRLNTGELSRFIVHNHHPAIISTELFQKAQAVLESRSPKNRVQAVITPFSGKITCGSCGCHYMRRTINGVKKWQCNTYWEQGKDACMDAKLIPETVLESLSADVLGIPVFNGQIFGQKIVHITVPCRNELDFHLADGKIVHRIWEDRSRRNSWTPEMREQAKRRSVSMARSSK